MQGFLLGRPAPADRLYHGETVSAQPELPAAPELDDMNTMQMPF